MPDRPLHILHLTAGSDAGGLSRYIIDLSTALVASGHRVSVAGERGVSHALFEAAPFTWIDAPLKGGPLALYRASRTLRRYLHANPADVFHTHYRKPTLVARRLQRSVGPGRGTPPVLYTLHLSHISLAGPRRWLSDFGDHTHVASADARDWLTTAARVPATRITLIPHGVDPARFPLTDPSTKLDARRALGLSPFDRLAVFVGRLDTPKNAHWMLDVAAATRERIPRLRVLLVGDGPDAPALRTAVAAQALGDRVIFLGYRDPLPVYRAADALLLPSDREGFSLVCAEAMSTGLPVLRTRTSGTAELVVEGITGRSTPIDRAAFLVAAADFLADDAGLARMGRAAADHVRRTLPFSAQVDRTIALYHALAEGRRP